MASRRQPSEPIEFEETPPHAASLVESLRAFGYELPTAIADLVDNSVTAGAKHVWIDFLWDGESSAICITDDGRGMTEDALRAAMRPGSSNPLEIREPHDLGRFGLGLKTASFSQCRRLTVRTKTKKTPEVTRRWELDHIAKTNAWQLIKGAAADTERFLRRLGKLPQGTTIVWQDLDRLVKGQHTTSDRDQQLFLHRADAVRLHLGMVFHQMMSGAKSVRLLINDQPIEPWDPFLATEPATQVLPATQLKIRGEIVEVFPFVLPHHSKLSKVKHEAAGGPHGWNAHQGFYVYRNRRLLVAGDWLGFGWAKEEHYKLARIRVEVPNSLDHDWQIDVTKSRAFPPVPLRADLRRIADRTRGEAKRVYSHRGARLTPKAEVERLLLWEPVAKHDKTFYRLNRQHPLLKRAIAASSNKPALAALLRLIEETIPLPHITIENSENPNALTGPFEHATEAQVREVMEEGFNSLVASGYGAQDAVNRLKTIWPFELFPALLQALAESKGHV